MSSIEHSNRKHSPVFYRKHPRHATHAPFANEREPVLSDGLNIPSVSVLDVLAVPVVALNVNVEVLFPSPIQAPPILGRRSSRAEVSVRLPSTATSCSPPMPDSDPPRLLPVFDDATLPFRGSAFPRTFSFHSDNPLLFLDEPQRFTPATSCTCQVILILLHTVIARHFVW